jgi:hypothetical protein
MMRGMAEYTSLQYKRSGCQFFLLPKVGGVLEEQEIVVYGVDLAHPQGKRVQGLQLREETENINNNMLYSVQYTVYSVQYTVYTI